MTIDKENLKTDGGRLFNEVNKNLQLIKEINNYKEWQKLLQNENRNLNEKLNSEIEDKMQAKQMLVCTKNELNKLKRDYSYMQLKYDELKEDAIFLHDFRQQLTDSKKKCVDSHNLIKTLQSNLIEQENKFKLANENYKREKEKCQINETYMQLIMDKCTDQMYEKENEIALIRNELNELKHHMKSEEYNIRTLTSEIMILNDILNEKDKTIRDLKTRSQQQEHQEHLTKEYKSKITHMAATEVNLKNEIQDLKESLKLKSSYIKMAEKIASLQLKASLDTIQQLTDTCHIQSLKLKDIQNGIAKRCCDTLLPKATNNRFHKMEDLVDDMLKLKSKYKLMKKLCKMRLEKIKSLENLGCRCSRTVRIKFRDVYF